jgi:GTPase SAR1 family protein
MHWGLTWVKCMASGEIEARLHQLSFAASVAFAVRVGLRVLPWLALSKDKEVLARWPEAERARHLLTTLLAYDVGLMAVWDRRVSGLGGVARARRSAVDHTIAISTDDDTATAYAAAFAAYAAASAANTANTNSAASIAANANIGTAANAAAASDMHGFFSEFILQLTLDVNYLLVNHKNSAKELIESPLWSNLPPAPWSAQIIRFQETVRALNSDFDIWLDWYAARCQGKPIDVEQLKQRVFLPYSIVGQRPQQINAYIASLVQGTLGSPLNRVRTIFIGDGEAGKTSLIRVLNNEAVIEGIEAKTPGIAIREWQIPSTEIKASFWDFGGQVMVHATHQLFLRESCLYILLVSAREKEKATERAEYWLEHVKTFGKDAPVLIVANKADKEPVRLDEGLLLEKYPDMIKGFFQLACTEAQGKFRSQFEQFQQAFCQQLQAVGLHQVIFQKAHFEVLQNLRQRTPQQAFLTHQDYAALCAQHRVDAHGALDSSWLLGILDKLGVIVHFPDMDDVDEYILNPRWLTYGVYTLMYSEQARMTRKQAIALLVANPVQDHEGNTLSYPASKCRIIFEAMRRYKLCYFLPRDPDQLIIPALLPSDIKRHDFDIANALEFHYQFESFLPRHLISELIVECHEDIAIINEQDIVWQHGALLHNETHRTQALVQADYHFRRLSIWLTRSPTTPDFLAVLRNRVARIVKRIDIKYAQNIRLPREALLDSGSLPLEQEWADFTQILTMRNKNRQIYDHPSGSEYNINKILGLFEPQTSQTGGGNTTINIHNSTVEGGVTAAKTIHDSFHRK